MKPHKTTFGFKIAKIDGKKVVELNSRQFYQHYLETKTKVGEEGSLSLDFKKPSRTKLQLNYYWVIVGLLADYTGHTDEEMHEALMVLKFGKKTIKVGKDLVQVRKSISDNARFEKMLMAELIEFSLEKASELEIVVPSKESLGYISN